MDPLRSSQTTLLLAMGMSAYVGLLHLWYTRRPNEPQRWVALWSLVAIVFQASRLVQLHTRDPLVAVIAARFCAAAAPLLVASLICFAGSLAPRRPSGGRAAVFLTANVALSLLIAGTDWFVGTNTHEARDWFGASYISVRGEPTLLVIPVYMVAGCVWILRRVGSAPDLAPIERAVLLSSIGLYAAMGLFSVVASLGWIVWPGIAEYGPVVLGVALSFLLVHRQRRLEHSLQTLVDARTAQLAASEARYRGLIDNAPVGIFACDRQGRVMMRNPRLMEIIGAPPGAAAGPAPNLLAADAPVAGAAFVAREMRRCLTRGEVSSGETRYTSSFGRTSDLRVVLAPIRGESGDVTGGLGIVEDVSAQRVLEEGLRRSQKLESIGQLAAGIAHEINNPMAFVRTNLAVLREEWHRLKKQLGDGATEEALEERFAECESLIDESLEGVERTISIARDMREFAHSGTDQRAPADLNAIVEGCVRVASAHRKGATRIEERYGKLPPVWASAGQLRQVFLNLIVNALDVVGDSGLVRVETALEGTRALVRVKDDGPGILPEHRERLFDPFFTTKPAGEGTGLGLYISHQIVRGHGGEILVDSAPGRGAAFEVRLPLAPV
jgi:PAS domain S-box-containing protein